MVQTTAEKTSAKNALKTTKSQNNQLILKKNRLKRKIGRVAERFKAPVLKTDER